MCLVVAAKYLPLLMMEESVNLIDRDSGEQEDALEARPRVRAASRGLGRLHARAFFRGGEKLLESGRAPAMGLFSAVQQQ